MVAGRVHVRIDRASPVPLWHQLAEQLTAAAAELLVRRGATVTLTDVRPSIQEDAQLLNAGVQLELGGHRAATLRDADLIVLSPGVPPGQQDVAAARAAGVPVMGELELASRWLRGRIVAITGTKGKSTTTTLTGRMLEAGGHRGMFLADRVRMMAGDLTGPNSLQSVGAAAKAMGLPVRIVYFSNAEEYFDYNKQFVANVEALAGDEQSLVLRTIYSKKWVHADQLWAYQVQPLPDYRTRLGDRKNRSRNPMLRYAEIDGTLVRKGDTVFVELGSANRDPARYADPDVLDLARGPGKSGPVGHLAFGHGIHQCIGQHLARIELKIAFPSLFTRFPKLRLAVPEDELRHLASIVIGGLERMPVAWN